MDPVLNIICECLKAFSAVDALYLFGSRARGQAHARSDYDVGVCSRHPEELSLVEMQTRLVSFRIDNCDLVLIDPSKTVLANEIVKHGKVLFSRPDFDHHEFYLGVRKRYLDIQPMLARQTEALKQRYLDKFGGGA